MIRPLINAVLGLGYVIGFLFVWVGVEMLFTERHDMTTGAVTIGLGMIAWAVLVQIGRFLQHRNVPR